MMTSPRPSMEGQDQAVANTNSELFDDIKVKEMWQVQAIQLLKLYDNDLSHFIDSVVVYN